MDVVPRLLELDLSQHLVTRHGGVNTHGRPRRRVERYSHLGTWCVHIYRYHATLVVDGQPYEVFPGCATVLPPDAELEYRYRGRSTHACMHFTLAPRIPSLSAAVTRIPLLQNLGSGAAAANARLEQVIAWHVTNPARAVVRLLDLLWQLSDAAGETSTRENPSDRHPAVKQVLEYIELHLGEPLVIADLASGVGLSHNHLLRLFREATGTTIATHILNRRAQRAQQLLTRSTLTIKSIAAQVGLPDLHHFNKVIRRVLGAPPRAIRAANG